MRWIILLGIIGTLISCSAAQPPVATVTPIPNWLLSYVQSPLTEANLVVRNFNPQQQTIATAVNGPACFSQGRVIYTTATSTTKRLLVSNLANLQTETLVDDPEAVLSQATCHPISDQVLYLRSPLALIDDEPAPPSIWQIDTDVRQPQSLDAAQTPALNQQWSPDGRWLIYELADRPQLVLQDHTGVTRELTLTGTFTWQPDSQAVIIAQLTEPTTGRFGRLVRYDLATEQVSVVLESPDADVYYPRLTPDGKQLAYIRRPLGAELGEVWLLKFKNSQRALQLTNDSPIQLTNDPRYDNFDPQWAPGSQELIWTRLDPQQSRYSIWYQVADMTSPIQLADDAIWPRWLP